MPMVIFIDDSETALASTRMVTNSMPIEVKQYLDARVARITSYNVCYTKLLRSDSL